MKRYKLFFCSKIAVVVFFILSSNNFTLAQDITIDVLSNIYTQYLKSKPDIVKQMWQSSIQANQKNVRLESAIVLNTETKQIANCFKLIKFEVTPPSTIPSSAETLFENVVQNCTGTSTIQSPATTITRDVTEFVTFSNSRTIQVGKEITYSLDASFSIPLLFEAGGVISTTESYMYSATQSQSQSLGNKFAYSVNIPVNCPPKKSVDVYGIITKKAYTNAKYTAKFTYNGPLLLACLGNIEGCGLLLPLFLIVENIETYIPEKDRIISIEGMISVERPISVSIKYVERDCSNEEVNNAKAGTPNAAIPSMMKPGTRIAKMPPNLKTLITYIPKYSKASLNYKPSELKKIGVPIIEMPKIKLQ